MMIDTKSKLAAFLPELQAAPWVALDTEADSLHAYPEKLCLVQISTPAGDDLIDPLAALDLNPLLEALNDHELIMHGADYDLRLLRKHHQFIPSAIFDTMLAARLIGHRQFSLVDLVEHYLGVKLEKGPQKADWARRPLTPRMEAYARNDTLHLKPLADRLRADLEVKGRLRWHQESCAQLVAECAVPREPNPDVVWRVKGSHRLNPLALAVLRELWAWREQEALAVNKPPFFILNHEKLVLVADAAAHSRRFDAVLPKNFSRRRWLGLRRAVTRGLALAAHDHPEIHRAVDRRPTDAQKRRFLDLQRCRDAHAAQLGIEPSLIASKGMLFKLAEDWKTSVPELMNWQRELLENQNSETRNLKETPRLKSEA